MRLAVFSGLLAAAGAAFAQGSAAGYGQSGGFAGGGAGGPGSLQAGERPGTFSSPLYQDGKFGINLPNDKEGFGRPETDKDSGLWTQKSAVLTPGDKVEYKFDLKKGETLLAAAMSEAFDPMLAVEDSKGKVLASNDDREEGDQSPFLIFKAPDTGTYVLKVQSMKSVSGGKFTASFRTFMPIDASLNSAKVSGLEDRAGNRVIFRLPGRKGVVYDLRSVYGIGRNRSWMQFMRIIGPNGVESDIAQIPSGGSTPSFIANADGDYYLEYYGTPSAQYQTEFWPVTITPMTTSSTESMTLQPGEMKVYEFEVHPDLVVRTTMTGEEFESYLTAPTAEQQGVRGDGAFGTNEAWSWYLMNIDSPTDVVRVFHGKGKAQFVIRSQSAKAQKITMASTEVLPLWAVGAASSGKMEIGDSKLFVVKSSKSELMKVMASATTFVPRLDIFRLNGLPANTLMDRKTRTAADDLYFPDADTFLVRLSCDGYGGGGDYTMKRDTLNPSPYQLSKPELMKLDGSNFGLFAVNLEAGKRYELISDGSLRVDLIDDDGEFLRSQRIGFDKVSAEYFVPQKSGRHRLWLRGEPGTYHFKFAIHVPPAIPGGS